MPSTSSGSTDAPIHREGLEDLEIDWLLLADWAESISGKIYIQGGGWDRRLATAQGAPIDFSVAAGILVPWHLTNQQHQFALSFETDDGKELDRVEGGVSVGRPLNSVQGQKMRIPVALRASIELPDLGAYRAKLTLNGAITKSVAFYIVERL